MDKPNHLATILLGLGVTGGPIMSTLPRVRGLDGDRVNLIMCKQKGLQCYKKKLT